MNILSNYRVPREVEIYTGKAIRPAIGCLVFFLIVFPDILRLIPRDFSLLKLILSLFPLPVCSLLILGSIAGFRDLPGWNKQLLWKPGHYFSWSLTFKMFLFNFILSLLLVHLMQKIGELLRISIPPQPLGQILAQSSPLACIIIGFAVIILAP